MAEDLQCWVHEGDIWGATNPPMLQPCMAVATQPVICDVNNWRVDEQTNDYSNDGGALTIDPTSCFNMPGFDLLPSAHGNWPDQDFSGRAIDRSHSVMIQEEEEVNRKRYKLNRETTSAWSPNNFSGSISPTEESTTNDDFCGDQRLWNSLNIEPTCKGVLCNNTLGPSAAFLSSLQSVDDHSNVIASREQIALISSRSVVAKRHDDIYADHVDSLCVKDDEYLLRKVRTETSSPLATFKVRKEKLGDHVTALQQLVSPFGKTDTASVLNEAVQYIEFLHNQIRVLSCPYMKNHDILKPQQVCHQSKDGPQRDLRSLGLCLVPISSTTTVDNYEITAPVSETVN